MEELQPRLAVDLGTTWTAASRATESGVEAVPLGSGHPSMPSVVARDGDQFVVGEPAERVLDGRPESGAREIKRRFGDTTPVVIDGQPFGADALMAEILRHVARTAHPDGWADVDVVLTHPANWGAYKLELLTNIGQQVGFRQVVLQSEPVAAAAHFVETGRVQPGDVVAVYDFGGGTFDAAVVRVGEDAAVLGTPQGLERLGGIDVDQMVFAHVAASLGGQLSQLDSNDPEVRRGVARLRAECTRAKEALSSDSDAMIPVSLPSIQTKVRITRPELEAILRQRVDETLATLDRAIVSAGVTADDLAAVVLVGGSSQIPLVAESLRAHTGRPTLFGNDPKLVVAAGALEGAVRASRSTTTAAATTTTSTAATGSPKPTEESPMTDASGVDTAAAAAAAAAAAKRDKSSEVAATVVAEPTGAAEGTQPAAASGTGTVPASPSTTSASAEHGSRTPAPPPPKQVASKTGRIAGGIAGAAAAVAGGIVFHEQLAAASGIDPQVGGAAMPGVMQVAGAAASAAGAAAVSLGERDDADDAAGGASAPGDVDTQLSNASGVATDDDSMDAFDDDPVAPLAAAAAANPGDASVGDVDTAPTFDPRAPLAAAADAAPVVDAPEPAVQGDTFPPIDDFSTIVLPTSAPAPSAPDDPSREPTLGPKVGFTEPSSRPSAPQFGDDDDRPRVPQPTSAPMPAAQVHAATPLTPTQPTQAPPAPPAAPAAPAAAAMAAAAVATPTAPVTGIATDPFDDDAQDDAGAGSSPGVPDGGDGGDGAGDDAFDAAKARLIDRVAGFDPPAGATPAETADLKADLQQMIDRFVPLPGESTADALAALHAQYDDRVHVFNQDQKIDALIQETRRDNAREQAQQHSSQGDDAPATGTSPASGTSATHAGDAPDDVPTMNVPPVDAGQAMPTQPVPAEDQAPPPVELHPDNDVTNAIRTEATQILQQMESDRRATFGGGIQDPQTTMQYYANQQVHMAQLQQLVSDQQAVALKTDGGMPSDALLDRINAATVGLVAQANSAMMQATQQYASATGIPQIFTPPPLVPIPVVVPDLPDPASIPDPEPAAAAEPPSAAYDAVASQVAAINQAMAQQAGANGLPFTPIQVPMDPTDAAPDLAAVNAGVAAQVAASNAQMAAMASAMNRPMVQIPVPTITLPDDVPTDTTPDAGQAAGPVPDPGSGRAMGESGPDAPSAAFDAVATQVAAINQAMAQQAGANGLPFTPIQVPMDPTDAAPDLAAVNAAVAAQVASANAQMASMASALNLPPVQIPTPTIVLPDGLGDTAIPSAGEAQDDGDDDAFPVGQTPGTAAPLAGPSVAASQATYGAADQATYGTAETAAFQGAGASSGDAPDPDPGTSGAADVATYGTANVAAANTAGLSDADQPSNGAISDGPGVAYTQGGAANLAAGQSGFAEAASALAANEGGDASDVDYRNAVLDGDPGIVDLPDPFDAQAAHAESQSIPDDNTGPASVPTSSPAPDDESNASDEAGKVLVVDSEAFAEHIIVDNATTAFGAAQPATALLGMVPAGTDVLGPSNLGEGEDSGSSEYGNDGDDGGSPGTDSRPYLPDASDVPDILGLDETNAVAAATPPVDDIQLPTIADAPAQDAPPVDDIQLPVIPDTPPVDDPAPPPPPADMPDLVLPDIPAAPDAPDLSQIPDLPDLPDPPSQPDPQDFPADDGPSFGDDIGNDVSPSDPTTTDF